MRIVLAPVGTRGDVEPLAALGIALRQRGHSVLLVAPANFDRYVRELGLDFAIGAPDYTEFLRQIQHEPFLQVLARQVSQQFAAFESSADGADAIVGSMLQIAAPSICEKQKIPYYYMAPAPVFIRSAEHPPVTVRSQQLPRWVNKLAWRARGWQWNRSLLKSINLHREALGLRAVSDAQDHVLHSGHVLMSCEPSLAPIPTYDGARVTVTGSWYLDRGTLDPELARFCSDGPPPIFIGFGSMVSADPKALLETIFGAVRRTGVRAVIFSSLGQTSREPAPGSCRVISAAPFYKLFPKVRAVIHHGGAGTTATAARAGVPQAIVPHFADQYYWGQLVARRGLGPPALPVERISEANLSAIIRTLLSSPNMTSAAQAIAKNIDPAAGVRSAIAEIEQSR